jgi:REP element-mobilizing transposase RayT
MGYARKNLVSLGDTPYYHVVARCVRRAWLWGIDEYAGRDYSHRKDWVLERLAELTSIFSIDVCAYAVMSNHYHLVVYVDLARSKTLSKHEVVERWSQLFRPPLLVQRWRDGTALDAERTIAEHIIEKWRTRLSDLSWFMKCLNEHLARRANTEDNCDGRFWQGRFRSQALLDEAGLLTAMAYVDLNTIRARIATTPEESEFTSVYERIKRIRDPEARSFTRVPLRRFSDEEKGSGSAIPYSLHDYLRVVDWSGRSIRVGKRGFIAADAPPVLKRLNIDAESWEVLMTHRRTLFGRAMGKVDAMRLHAASLNQAWIRGVRSARHLYSN